MTPEHRKKLEALTKKGKYKKNQRYAAAEREEVRLGLKCDIDRWEEYNVKFDPLKDRYKGLNVRKYIATTSRGQNRYVVYEVEVYSDLKVGDLTVY